MAFQLRGGFDYFVLRNEALQISVQPPTERFQQEKKKNENKKAYILDWISHCFREQGRGRTRNNRTIILRKRGDTTNATKKK